MSWIVKETIDTVPRKILAHFAAGTGTFTPDEISPRSTRRTHSAQRDVNVARL
jgi:hypothetical protein